MKFSTTADFIEKARKIHGNKYDYSKVEYIDYKTKVCIICPIHGEFWQKPSNHLKGYGCTKCAYEMKGLKRRSNTLEFIEKAHKIYGDFYDLSKVTYEKNTIKVPIICPHHGEFLITPNDFLDGHGCPECATKKISDKLSNITQEEFLKRCKEIHGDKYDYSEAIYNRWEKKVKIVCPEHGEFWQTPHSHIGNGNGCPKCGKEKSAQSSRLSIDKFILKSNKVHNNRYDYSKVEYVNCITKVCIVCPKHGEFWQTAQDHLNGHGCPKCNCSKMESEIMNLLHDYNIPFIYNKFYKQLEGLQLDFYIPSKNIAIECQGEHHIKPVTYNPLKIQESINALEELRKRDRKKLKLCNEFGIKLLYYTNIDEIFPYDIFIDKNKLLETILNAPEISQGELREIY